MTALTLPSPRTVRNARRNAPALAELIRDGRTPAYNGRQSANGERCAMCGRTPPSDQLYQVVIDSIADTGVFIGIGVCHRRYLGRALRALLARERSLNDPARADGIARLEEAIRAVA
jgi:hypothetical protein